MESAQGGTLTPPRPFVNAHAPFPQHALHQPSALRRSAGADLATQLGGVPSRRADLTAARPQGAGYASPLEIGPMDGRLSICRLEERRIHRTAHALTLAGYKGTTLRHAQGPLRLARVGRMRACAAAGAQHEHLARGDRKWTGNRRPSPTATPGSELHRLDVSPKRS